MPIGLTFKEMFGVLKNPHDSIPHLEVEVFVEFHATVFHCSQIPALSKAFPSYVIPPYRAVSFVVVRHHRLADDYWAAISYRLGLIALFSFGGVYFVGTDDAFRG